MAKFRRLGNRLKVSKKLLHGLFGENVQYWIDRTAHLNQGHLEPCRILNTFGRLHYGCSLPISRRIFSDPDNANSICIDVMLTSSLLEHFDILFERLLFWLDTILYTYSMQKKTKNYANKPRREYEKCLMNSHPIKVLNIFMKSLINRGSLLCPQACRDFLICRFMLVNVLMWLWVPDWEEGTNNSDSTHYLSLRNLWLYYRRNTHTAVKSAQATWWTATRYQTLKRSSSSPLC